MSSRVNTQEEKSFLYERQNSGKRFAESKRLGGSRRFQLPKGSPGLISVSPMRLLKHIAGHVARAVCMTSGKRPPPSGKSSLSSARSKPFVAPLDSHRMEAIEDCIQFINSSCTLSRSNSTTIS